MNTPYRHPVEIAPEQLEFDARVEQAKQAAELIRTYNARTTTTTAQDKAQIKLLSRIVLVLMKQSFDQD